MGYAGRGPTVAPSKFKLIMRRFIDSLLGFPRCRLPSRFESGSSLCALSFQRGLSIFDGIQLLAKCSGGPFICIAKQSVEWAEYGEIQQDFYFLYIVGPSSYYWSMFSHVLAFGRQGGRSG